VLRHGRDAASYAAKEVSVEHLVASITGALDAAAPLAAGPSLGPPA
jgi:hypothetical protein